MLNPSINQSISSNVIYRIVYQLTNITLTNRHITPFRPRVRPPSVAPPRHPARSHRQSPSVLANPSDAPASHPPVHLPVATPPYR